MTLDPPEWSFDVTTALHDDVKQGGDYPRITSRVTISRTECPTWPSGMALAACIAMAVHGGMAIEVLARY